MPRIDASSLSEHRRQRENAITEAGIAIARSDGIDAVTMSSVAQRVGITRTALYEYTPSTKALRERIRIAHGHSSRTRPDAQVFITAITSLVETGAVSATLADRFIEGGLAALPVD